LNAAPVLRKAAIYALTFLEQAEGGDLDESSRETGLESLRKANFDRLIARLKALPMPGAGARPKLLDVGCAHG